MNELPVFGPCVCANIFGMAIGQALQVARRKYMAKGCFDVRKRF